MEITLRPFSSPAVLEEIHCAVTLEQTLVLQYLLAGDMTQIHWPSEDGIATENPNALWQSTCFEYFIGDASNPGYFEFNQSTSGNGAGFAFSAYRSAPVRSNWLIADSFFMTRDSTVGEVRLEVPTPTSPFWLGLAVILEGLDGRLHYFAPGHPAEAPDFHSRDYHQFIDIDRL